MGDRTTHASGPCRRRLHLALHSRRPLGTRVVTCTSRTWRLWCSPCSPCVCVRLHERRSGLRSVLCFLPIRELTWGSSSPAATSPRSAQRRFSSLALPLPPFTYNDLINLL